MSDSIRGTVVTGLSISDLSSHRVKASLVGLKVVEHFPVTSSRSIVDVVEGSPFPSLDVASTNLHLGAAISDLEVGALASALLIVETVETNGSVDMSVLNRASISSLSLSSNWIGASFVAGVLGECFVITSSRWSVIVEPVGPFVTILVARSVDKTLFTAESDLHIDTFVFATSGSIVLLIVVTSVSVEVKMLDKVQRVVPHGVLEGS